MIEINPNEALLESEVDLLIHKANAQNEQILIDFSEYLREAGLAPQSINN